ncbi:MAG: hypothetical protein ACKPE1_31315 [Dolichospermum sp.]
MGWASCPPVVYLITPESAVFHQLPQVLILHYEMRRKSGNT